MVAKVIWEDRITPEQKLLRKAYADAHIQRVKELSEMLPSITEKLPREDADAVCELVMLCAESIKSLARQMISGEALEEAAPKLIEAYLTGLAKHRAWKRLKNDKDGKQAAKAEVKELWKERRAGKHLKLRTNEQFAMECMRRWPTLTSLKVILGWCTTWNKEARASKP